MNADRLLFIGVGNPYRRDDGVGGAVAAALRRRCDAGHIDVIEETGDLTRVLPLWRGRDLVVLVDAAVCGCGAGTVHRLEHGGAMTVAPIRTAPLSSHGFTVADAIEMARALDAAPRRVVVFAVAAADVGHGLGLSPAVAAAVDPVTDAVVNEITSAVSATTRRHNALTTRADGNSVLIARAGVPYP